MNPLLLPLFLDESREMVERGNVELLRLDRAEPGQPGWIAALDQCFRVFHTLKGASALFDFAPLTGLLHAAEDVLAQAREAGSPPPGMVDDALACLDCVAAWLETIENTGHLPEDAAQRAATLVARLHPSRAAAPNPVPASAPDWVASLRPEERDAVRALKLASGESLLAIEYLPDPTCFFRGDDPLALFRQVPNLAVLRIEPADAPPALDGLDPFRAWVRLRAIAIGMPATLHTIFRLAGNQVAITTLSDAAFAAPPPTEADDLAAALLADQCLLLEMPAPAEELAGRIGAAARIATAALGPAAAAAITEAAARAIAHASAAPLLAAIRAASTGAEAEPDHASAPGATRRPLRVDPARLEQLVGLADEAMVTKNALRDIARRAQDLWTEQAGNADLARVLKDRAELARALKDRAELARALKDRTDQLDRLVVELHGLAARMRMIPAGQLFKRLPRLVRDLARQLGKQVRLVLAGEEHEADRDLLEALFEPLVHLVRNSLDHGIEPAEERQRLGKPPIATLTLRARSEADGLVIELVDDGRGIDPAVLRRRAVEQALLSSEAAAALDDGQALDLVFTARLSTATAVSTVSGRGVGMAAVRQAVTELGGNTGLTSQPGQGTLVWLHVPMRLSLSRIVLVRLGSQWFGLTLDMVVETIRLPRARIQPVRHGQAAILGDRLVPLLDVRRKLALLETAPQQTAAQQTTPQQTTPQLGATAQLVVLAGDAGETAIEVDAIGERQEAIMRPLVGLLAATPFVLGTTLLGNGTVLLVLDVRALLG